MGQDVETWNTAPQSANPPGPGQPRGPGGGRWEPAPGTRREAVPSKTSPGPCRAGTIPSPPALGHRHLHPSPWLADCRVHGVGRVSLKVTTSAAGDLWERKSTVSWRAATRPVGLHVLSRSGRDLHDWSLSFLSSFNSLISLFRMFVE